MAKMGLAPELSDSDTPKVRTCKDGTKKYYMHGMLHREPTHGPAIEEPDGSGECYVRGVKQDAVWFCGKYFGTQAELDASIAPPETSNEEITQVTIETFKRTPKPAPIYLRSGVSTQSSTKPKDPFNKLGARVKGMAELMTLYADLTSNKQSGAQSG